MQCRLIRLFHGNRRFLEITQERFDQVVAARQSVIEILHIEEKFVFLIENFRELEIEALSNTFRNATIPQCTWSEIISDIHLFNRRIMNLLTTCRVYLDHTPHHLSTVFPKDDTVKNGFTASLKERHSASFSYRVLEALRNYVQHRGLPFTELRRNARIIDIANRNAGSEHTLEFIIDRNRLIDDPKFKRSVANELKATNGRIDLRPMIREYVAILSDAHQELRKTLDTTFNVAAKTVSDAITEYSQGDKELEGDLYAVQENGQGKVVSKFYLDHNPAKRRTEIVGRYSHLSSITRQFTTSAPPL